MGTTKVRPPVLTRVGMRYSDLLLDPTPLDALIGPILKAARIPGAAVAIAVEGQEVLSRGFGYLDLARNVGMSADTAYPIASTTKAMNATLVGMLVDEGKLAWDVPVQTYLPSFRLADPVATTQATLRDLLAMRTGLPRHDWIWVGSALERSDLVYRLRYLEPSAGFREKFQYNNLTATTAGHIAEVVAGQPWEELIRTRILEPLGMSSTGFAMPANRPVTVSYHENSDREVLPSTRLASGSTAPSGGAIHSTVEDMALWILFNLRGGRVGERALIQPKTFAEIQAPQVPARTDPSCPTPHAAYGMGWFIDTYNGHSRISHAGYLHDVNSDVALFPQDGFGIVTFTNFGFPKLAPLINQQVFDLLKELEPAQSVDGLLSDYENRIVETRRENGAVRHVAGTVPSHPLEDYVGCFSHPGYGEVYVRREANDLVLQRYSLTILLERWHYDVWIAKDLGRFFLHAHHAFDRSSRLMFGTNADGEVATLLLPLEPSVAPIRFEKRNDSSPR